MQFGHSILIVDRMLGGLTLLGIMLERGGYHALKANDAEEAINMLQGHSPDMMLVDTHIANHDNCKLIKDIRKDPFYADMPIILMSSGGSVQSIRDALTAGATEHILQPLLHQDLLTTIRRHLVPRAAEPFPRNNALLLHGTHPPMQYIRQLCDAVAARIDAPVIALPSRRDGNGRNKDLGEALRSASSLTVCMTTETLDSKAIQFACDFFAQHNKRLTAILYEDVELPDAFNTAHVFRPDELEQLCTWLASVHQSRRS